MSVHLIYESVSLMSALGRIATLCSQLTKDHKRYIHLGISAILTVLLHVQTGLCSVIDTSSECSGLLHAQTGLHLSGSHHSVSHRHLIYTTDLHVQTGSNNTLSVIDTSSTPRMSECSGLLHAQTGLHLSGSHHSVSHRHLTYTMICMCEQAQTTLCQS